MNESGSTGITMQIFDAEGNDVTPGIGNIHVNTPDIQDKSDPDIRCCPTATSSSPGRAREPWSATTPTSWAASSTRTAIRSR